MSAPPQEPNKELQADTQSATNRARATLVYLSPRSPATGRDRKTATIGEVTRAQAANTAAVARLFADFDRLQQEHEAQLATLQAENEALRSRLSRTEAGKREAETELAAAQRDAQVHRDAAEVNARTLKQRCAAAQLAGLVQDMLRDLAPHWRTAGWRIGESRDGTSAVVIDYDGGSVVVSEAHLKAFIQLSGDMLSQPVELDHNGLTRTGLLEAAGVLYLAGMSEDDRQQLRPGYRHRVFGTSAPFALHDLSRQTDD